MGCKEKDLKEYLSLELEQETPVGETSNPSVVGGEAIQNSTSIVADWENMLYFFSVDGETGKTNHTASGIAGGRTVTVFAADLLAGQYNIKIGGATVATQNTDANGILQRTSISIPSGTGSNNTIEISK